MFCFPIFWLSSRSLTHLLETSVVFRVFDHAEWIEMTFVFWGFLSLTKCYSEFRSFQANYPNPCHCLQQTSSEAVLITSLIFVSLIEMVSLQVLLNFLFPCSFFLSHYSLFSIQKLRGASKPCADHRAFMDLFSSPLKVDQRKSRQTPVWLFASLKWLPQTLGSVQLWHPPATHTLRCASWRWRSSSLFFLLSLWKHRSGDF